MGRMFRLDEFRYDGAITSAEVSVRDEPTGETVVLSTEEAIRLAHDRGSNLVAWWPGDIETPSCIIAKVTEPLRWERAPRNEDVEPFVDERLWFRGWCGDRDYLVQDNTHTFNGRMSAWCPTNRVAYNVSLSEIDELSDESKYFIVGFLAGDGPAPPYDDEGDVAPEDLLAWQAATQRFHRTGSWYGRWGTCSVCGCVLLPGTADDRCHEHPERKPS